jgi:dihydrofolate synthase/folylpolyglutamate synthase
VSSPSLTYLFSLEQVGIKLGLEQIRALIEHLGHPDEAFQSLVIAGTNGKGSVTAMVERGLRAAGYRTGRYISPHLVRLEERFAVDGVPIETSRLEALAERVREVAGRLPFPPSFFEATTAVAFEAFREARVDVAVLEVGLGGRLDATNVVKPVGVAITAIDFDHEQYLGHTIEEIAGEKAGVIKPGVIAVLGENPAAVVEIVRRACSARGAEFVFAPDEVAAPATMVDGRARVRLRTPRHDYGEMTIGLRGRHQVDNAIVAVRLLEELAVRRALRVAAPAIRTAVTDVAWPARLELLPWRGRHVLLDGAHNPAGARALASYVQETYGRRLPFVIGAMRDKKIPELIGGIAPAASHLVCTAPTTPRAATPAEVATIARAVAPGLDVREALNSIEALTVACDLGDPVVAAGSLYLAGEIRNEIT